MKNIFLVLVFGLSLLNVSCRKNVCENCGAFYRVTGFDSSEIAHIVRKRYERTPDFAHYISTDTTSINLYGSEYDEDFLPLDASYNYIIEIGGRTFKIRDIYYDARTDKASGIVSEITPCDNIVHYTLNDSFYTFAPLGFEYSSGRFTITLQK